MHFFNHLLHQLAKAIAANGTYQHTVRLSAFSVISGPLKEANGGSIRKTL
jgi:hypothetical protein